MVVLDHMVSHHIVSTAVLPFFSTLGREAVVIFFVLSGFVIAYVTDVKKQTLAQYAVARAARIYSVALPLLLMSFTAAYIAVSVAGISLRTDYQLHKLYLYLPFHSLCLGELWTQSETPLWLDAYWSLSYEVWYYLFFGAVFFLRGRTRLISGSIIFMLLGYKLWLLLPVWYGGVFLWKMRDRLFLPVKMARWGMVFSLVLLVLYKFMAWDDSLRSIGRALWPFSHFPLGSADRYLADYLVAFMVMLNFHCARQAGLEHLSSAAKWITSLASYTFPLYLAHGLVIAVWWNCFSPRFDRFDGFDPLFIVFSIVLVTYLTGVIAEVFKGWLQRKLTPIADFTLHTVVKIPRGFSEGK